MSSLQEAVVAPIRPFGDAQVGGIFDLSPWQAGVTLHAVGSGSPVSPNTEIVCRSLQLGGHMFWLLTC